MKTKVQISLKDYVQTCVISGTLYKLQLIIGLIATKAIEVYAKLQEGVNSSQNGMLTPEMVEHIRTICEEKTDDYINARQAPFTEEEIAHPTEWQSFGAKLLYETLLDRHSLGVRSALNVGGYNDRHFSYMAQKFPDVSFCSVDFMSESKMHQFNDLLPQSPNWNLKSGYALELLQKGEVDADLVFFSSTALLINNKELDLYLDELARRSKVIVINEAWGVVSTAPRLSKLGLLPRVIRPEDIPEDAPAVRSMSGVYFFYAHNYPAKLEKRGFKVRLSTISSANNPALYLYQVVAVKTGNGGK